MTDDTGNDMNKNSGSKGSGSKVGIEGKEERAMTDAGGDDHFNADVNNANNNSVANASRNDVDDIDLEAQQRPTPTPAHTRDNSNNKNNKNNQRVSMQIAGETIPNEPPQEAEAIYAKRRQRKDLWRLQGVALLVLTFLALVFSIAAFSLSMSEDTITNEEGDDEEELLLLYEVITGITMIATIARALWSVLIIRLQVRAARLASREVNARYQVHSLKNPYLRLEVIGLLGGWILTGIETAISAVLTVALVLWFETGDADLLPEANASKGLLLALCIAMWLALLVRYLSPVRNHFLFWSTLLGEDRRIWTQHNHQLYAARVRLLAAAMCRPDYLCGEKASSPVMGGQDQAYATAEILADMVHYQSTGITHAEFLTGLAICYKQDREDVDRIKPSGKQADAATLARCREAVELYRYAAGSYTGAMMDLGRAPIASIVCCTTVRRQTVPTFGEDKSYCGCCGGGNAATNFEELPEQLSSPETPTVSYPPPSSQQPLTPTSTQHTDGNDKTTMTTTTKAKNNTSHNNSSNKKKAKNTRVIGDNAGHGHERAFCRYSRLDFNPRLLPSAGTATPQNGAGSSNPKKPFLVKGRVHHGTFNVTFFITAIPETESLCVSIRGTENQDDLLTDSTFRTERLTRHDFGDDFDDANFGSNLGAAHHGILQSARSFLNDVEEDLEGYVREGGPFHNYSIVFVGHSLGGSVSALSAIRLRSKLMGLGAYDVRAIAYNPMSTLDARAIVVTNSQPLNAYRYVISLPYRDDILSRLSRPRLMKLRDRAVRLGYEHSRSCATLRSWLFAAKLTLQCILHSGNGVRDLEEKGLARAQNLYVTEEAKKLDRVSAVRDVAPDMPNATDEEQRRSISPDLEGGEMQHYADLFIAGLVTHIRPKRNFEYYVSLPSEHEAVILSNFAINEIVMTPNTMPDHVPWRGVLALAKLTGIRHISDKELKAMAEEGM